MARAGIPDRWGSAVRDPRRTLALMTTPATRSRVTERVERICADEPDARTLRLRVLEVLRDAVAFDAFVWLVTDPVTAVGSAPVADVPCLSELPRLIRLKYLTSVNRWTALARRADPVALLDRETRGDRSRSLVWRELLRDYAIGDVASVVLADRQGCWGFLDLWRGETSARFGDDEAGLLGAIAPRLTRAIRETQARTFVAPAATDRRALGPAVLLLDEELTITARTAATDTWLELLLPTPEGRPPVPASVYNVAAQLLAAEQHVDEGRALARVHLADGLWVTLRAARLDAAAAPRQAGSRSRSRRPRLSIGSTSSRARSRSRPAKRSCSDISPAAPTRETSLSACSSRSTRCRTISSRCSRRPPTTAVAVCCPGLSACSSRSCGRPRAPR